MTNAKKGHGEPNPQQSSIEEDVAVFVQGKNERNIEQFIIDVGNKEAYRILKTQSKKAADPCLSVVYDPVLDKVYFGQNYKSKSVMATEEYEKWIAEEADPIIKERKEKYQIDIDKGIVDLPEKHDLRLAAHSEVRALDKALRERRALGMTVNEDSISEMYVYNIDLTKLYNENVIVPKDRCENCSRITDGIKTIGHN